MVFFPNPNTIRRVDGAELSIGNDDTLTLADEGGTTELTEAGFQPDPLNDEDRDDMRGLVREGEAILYTETELTDDDVIEVCHDDNCTETSRWRVRGQVEDMTWFDKHRDNVTYAYALQRLENA